MIVTIEKFKWIYNTHEQIKKEIREYNKNLQAIQKLDELIKKHGDEVRDRERNWYDTWEGEKSLYPFRIQLKREGFHYYIE